MAPRKKSGLAYFGVLTELYSIGQFRFPEAAVTSEERARMEELCRRIAIERDPETFDRLVAELNDLLELKHQRIHPEHRKTSK